MMRKHKLFFKLWIQFSAWTLWKQFLYISFFSKDWSSCSQTAMRDTFKELYSFSVSAAANYHKLCCCCFSLNKSGFFRTMDCTMQGFPVLQNLLEFAQLTPIESVMPSNYLILCHPLLLLPSSFPASGYFQMSQLFASGGQSIGVSASISVLPMNTQDWFPLGWTGWTSL